MTKRSCYDEDDKACLLHVLTLLNNLDALTRDQDVDQVDHSSTASSSTEEVGGRFLSLVFPTYPMWSATVLPLICLV